MINSICLTYHKKLKVWITNINTKKFGVYTKISIDWRLGTITDGLVKMGYHYISNNRYARFNIKDKTVEECIEIIKSFYLNK